MTSGLVQPGVFCTTFPVYCCPSTICFCLLCCWHQIQNECKHLFKSGLYILYVKYSYSSYVKYLRIVFNQSNQSKCTWFTAWCQRISQTNSIRNSRSKRFCLKCINISARSELYQSHERRPWLTQTLCLQFLEVLMHICSLTRLRWCKHWLLLSTIYFI